MMMMMGFIDDWKPEACNGIIASLQQAAEHPCCMLKNLPAAHLRGCNGAPGFLSKKPADAMRASGGLWLGGML